MIAPYRVVRDRGTTRPESGSALVCECSRLTFASLICNLLNKHEDQFTYKFVYSVVGADNGC